MTLIVHNNSQVVYYLSLIRVSLGSRSYTSAAAGNSRQFNFAHSCIKYQGFCTLVLFCIIACIEKKNCEDLATWLINEGVNEKDVKILKGAAIFWFSHQLIGLLQKRRLIRTCLWCCKNSLKNLRMSLQQQKYKLKASKKIYHLDKVGFAVINYT